MRPLRRDEIRGSWATVLLPIKADEGIDWGALREEVERLIEFRPDGIYTNGTAGEFYAQSEAEYDRIQEWVAARCEEEGIPFQIGASHPCPQVSLERIRRGVALQPGAFQVILPDWFPVVDDEAIDTLKRLADEAGGIPLVLYNPPQAKRVLEPAAWARIRREVGALAGVKVAGTGDASWYAAMVAALDGAALFVAGHLLATGYGQGAAGSYSNVACLHPGFARDWYRQMLADPAGALAVEGRIRGFLEEWIHPLISRERYPNPAIDKLLAAIGGWAPVGTRMRWPYRWVPRERVAPLREAALRALPELSGWGVG